MALRRNKVVSEELFNTHRESRLKRFRSPEEVEPDNRAEEPGAASVPPVEAPEKAKAQSPTIEVSSGNTDSDAAEAGPEPRGKDAEESADLEPKASEPEVVSPPTDTAPAKTEAPAKSPQLAKQKKAAAKGDTAYLRIKVPYPATGASPTFDSLVKLHGEKTAFRLVMKKALEDFAGIVLNGELAKTPNEYPEGSTILDTSRRLPRDVYEKAVSELDPMGITSERLMSNTIVRRALATFIASDRA